MERFDWRFMELMEAGLTGNIEEDWVRIKDAIRAAAVEQITETRPPPNKRSGSRRTRWA